MKMGCFALIQPFLPVAEQLKLIKKMGVDYADVTDNHDGGRHVVVHAGSSSFYDQEDFQAICCASWMNGTGHKKPYAFEVRISAPDHPIVQGLENFKITDELWFKPFILPDATVIAEAYSQHTGNWEPTAFVCQFGVGRCFTLLLGHNAQFMQQVGFKAWLISGTKWAAKLEGHSPQCPPQVRL